MKKALARDTSGRHGVTGATVRLAALAAAKRTRTVRRGAGNLAREAVEGAVQAVGEIGGEAGEFVKDTVVGVVQGTGEVVTITAPAVKEVVVGAIRGAGNVSADAGEVGRDAVEGAIVGAASLGIDSADAASAAAEGAFEAVLETGGDLQHAARATVGGVVSGVAAAGGDVAGATRDAAYQLMSHDAVAERDVAEARGLAEGAVDAALQEAEGTEIETVSVIEAAASGVVEAAYQVSQSHGDGVRQSVLRRILEPRLVISAELQLQMTEVAERLSRDLPRRRGAWRGAAMVRAVRVLLHAGGIDLAASLAYFTILSLLPMVALAIMAAAVVGDPEGISDRLTDVLIYYFPSSQELIHEAVENLLNGSLAIGLVAVVSIVVGANGLFMAANRSVNRVFGIEAVKFVQVTVTQVAFVTLVVVLFLLSVGLTAFLQVVVSFGQGIAEVTGDVSVIAVLVVGIVSTILPVVMTSVLFAIVYRILPDVPVEWRDATFGAIVAIVLFEIGKHGFFWFTGLATQRSAVYGPVASVVVLMMWGYIAGVIFLYGAALTKMAGELRPTSSPPGQTKA